MNFFSITVKLKEKTDNFLTYYYSTNRVDVDEKTAGIFTIDINVFEELPEELDPFYYSNYACKKLIEDQVIQIKIANAPLMLADGIDYNLIVAVRELLKKHKKTNIIPTTAYFIDVDRLKRKIELFPDLINLIPDNGELDQTTLNIILEECVLRTTN